MVRVTLFHTSDLHGKLSPEAAERIRRMKLEASPSLLLDAGDAVSAGNVGVRLKGEETLRRMTAAGYDALALGNREFHPWRALLRRKLGEAGFPILCANIRDPQAPIEPHRVLDLAGVRIAVFGLCVPMITPAHWARWISPYVFDDPVETAAWLVPSLRQEAEVVVALTHIGLEADRRLAAEIPDLDLILGGHSHTSLGAPEGVHPAILHLAPYGREIGRAVLEIGKGGTRLVSWDRVSLDRRAED